MFYKGSGRSLPGRSLRDRLLAPTSATPSCHAPLVNSARFDAPGGSRTHLRTRSSTPQFLFPHLPFLPGAPLVSCLLDWPLRIQRPCAFRHDYEFACSTCFFFVVASGSVKPVLFPCPVSPSVLCKWILLCHLNNALDRNFSLKSTLLLYLSTLFFTREVWELHLLFCKC